VDEVRGVRLTYGSGAVAPDGAKGFAVGLEYPTFNEPYGDIVSWHRRLIDANNDFEARVEMFLPAGRRAWTADGQPPPIEVIDWCAACGLPMTLARVDVHEPVVIDDPFGIESTTLWPVGFEAQRILRWEGDERVVRRYRYVTVDHPFPTVC
jgi:hypothetical protein